MADIGPSGPCSELHYDRGAHLSEGPECVPDHSEHCPRWLEIWNLVFMEFELHPDRSLTPLPAPGVDTGLGLERLASVLQGVTSNYDTDLFTPIHARMRELLGHDPEGFEAERFSYQVIADHSRAVTFLVADGVLPSNEGRGYVLRRILRRAVRHGRLLGRTEPFMGETAEVVIDTMADAYPHLAERRAEILGVIEREERQFDRTLEAGTGLLEEALIPLTSAERVVGRQAENLPADAPVLPGAVAFRLHDTYGFPIDLTVELAAEYGVRIDLAGFEDALAEQRDRSRAAPRPDLAQNAELRRSTTRCSPGPARPSSWAMTRRPPTQGGRDPSRRHRVRELEAMAEVELRAEAAARPRSCSTERRSTRRAAARSADRASFDRRRKRSCSRSRTSSASRDADAGLTVHRGMLLGKVAVGDSVTGAVDADRRADTMRNHTGTHLLHRALRNVVGDQARQAGSLVTPTPFGSTIPFDRALTDDEKHAIEPEVRRIVREDRPVIDRVDDDGRRLRRPAPTRSSTRSTATASVRSASRASATSCAAAPTAGRAARSATSSSRATGASAPASGASRQ